MQDRTEQKALIQGLMKLRRLDYQAVAKAVGFAPGTVRNVICGYSTSPLIRAAIQSYFAQVFWPASEENSPLTRANSSRTTIPTNQ